MVTSFLIAVLAGLAAPGPADTGGATACAREVRATSLALHLSELPENIKEDLSRQADLFGASVADRDTPLLQTDAPTAEEAGHATIRFAQGMQVQDRWFVQLEIAMFAGVRTLTYGPNGGGWALQPSPVFGGPACASIKAALGGVTTPGGFRPG